MQSLVHLILLLILLSEEELNKLQPAQIAELIKSLMTYQHKILYYGPKLIGDVKEALNTTHAVPAAGLKPVPAEANFVAQTFNNTVYVVDYDMKQAEIVILTEGEKFDAKNIPLISMYNELFWWRHEFGSVSRFKRIESISVFLLFSIQKIQQTQNCHIIISLISVLKLINCLKLWQV
jgi:hypothetical protein